MRNQFKVIYILGIKKLLSNTKSLDEHIYSILEKITKEEERITEHRYARIKSIEQLHYTITTNIQDFRQLCIKIHGAVVNKNIDLYIGIGSDVEEAYQAAVENQKQGKKQLFSIYEKDMKVKTITESKTNKEILEALKNQRIRAEVQPIYDIKDENKLKLVGGEVLIRFPDLDTSKAINYMYSNPASTVVVTDWIIDKGLEIVKKTKDIFIGINIPSTLITHNSVNNIVATIIRKVTTEDPLRRLHIEITENAADIKVEELSRLANMGIKLYLDDFGIKHSWFDRLHSSITGIKIDRSVLNDSPHLVKDIILQGKQYGFTIIQEGVETERQLKFLKSCGCELVQGFLFSRPIREDIFIKKMNERG